MDWGRAKSVLILAFLLLNIVLGYQLWLGLQERIDKSVDWTTLPAETQQLMQERGIRIDAKIPTETPMLRELTYKLLTSPETGGAKKITLDPPRETRIVFNTKELEDALGTVIPELPQFRFDYFGSRKEGEYVFNRMVDGLPLFDAQLILYYSEQQIKAYRQDKIEKLPSAGSEDQKVLPAAKAVASVMKYLPANAVVKEVLLGYHGQGIFDSETQVAAPSWRILLEDGKVFYVNPKGEVSSDLDGMQTLQAS